MKLKSKFKIGDIVFMNNDLSFNHDEDVTSIGKIEAIHIRDGKETLGVLHERTDLQTVYSISGFSFRPRENELELVEMD